MAKRIQSKKSQKTVENRTFFEVEKMKIPQWEPHNLINTRLQPGDHVPTIFRKTVLTVFGG